MNGINWEDRNGIIYTSDDPAHPSPWYLIINAQARGIPPQVKDQLFVASVHVEPIPDISILPFGTDFPTNTSLVGVAGGSSARWLLDGGTVHGIPSGQIFDQYQFDEGRVVFVNPIVFSHFAPADNLRGRP